MPRFDVFRNASKQTREDLPYLLDVQADLLADLATRVVVPLAKRTVVRSPLTRLNPVFTVENRQMIMLTTEIAGVPVAVLGEKVGSLAPHASEIIGAIDFLLTGV